MLAKANNVQIGDFIQHPTAFWPRREVLGINKVGTGLITFVILSVAWKGEKTLVTFNEDGDILIFKEALEEKLDLPS